MQQHVDLEWILLNIDPLAEKMANDLLKKHLKKAKTEYICFKCGKYFKEKFLKVIVYKVPGSTIENKKHYCKKCFKRLRLGTRGNG